MSNPINPNYHTSFTPGHNRTLSNENLDDLMEKVHQLSSGSVQQESQVRGHKRTKSAFPILGAPSFEKPNPITSLSDKVNALGIEQLASRKKELKEIKALKVEALALLDEQHEIIKQDKKIRQAQNKTDPDCVTDIRPNIRALDLEHILKTLTRLESMISPQELIESRGKLKPSPTNSVPSTPGIIPSVPSSPRL